MQHRKINIAINGLGRIGRCVLRGIFEYSEYKDMFNIVHINSPANNKTMSHLLQFDSTHGIFQEEITFQSENEIQIGNHTIKTTHTKNIQELDFSDIDIVFECSGKLNDKETLQEFIKIGAKRVILSAPSKKNDIPTFVYGVNDNPISIDDKIISIGSCTTNCLAPVAKIIHKHFGIENGFVTTIHAYTNDQNILDNSHKGDLRRARTAGKSIIPTSTGAAKAIGVVIPELNGKLNGFALRVPVENVSVIDCTFNITKNVTAKEINEVLKNASEQEMKNVLGFETKPLVSCDFNHSKYSSIIDSEYTQIIDKTLKILSWYDNEWGFSLRMLDMAKILFFKI